MAKYVIQQKTNANGTMADLVIAASCVESDSTKMDKSNPTGTGSLSINRKASTTTGTKSAAVGENTIAAGNYSHAEGHYTQAIGAESHAEGYSASSQMSVVISGSASSTTYTKASSSASVQIKVGYVLNYNDTYARVTEVNGNNITLSNTLSTSALSNVSVYMVKGIAYGAAAHTEGTSNIASGDSSHAEGSLTIANAYGSHAEGDETQAGGAASHAEGYQSYARGNYSHAEGCQTSAQGSYAHASGNNTNANKQSQFVFGEYNVLDNESNPLSHAANAGRYVEIVGNGTSTNTRSNARTLDWNGNEVLAGNVTAAAFKRPLGTSSQFLKADGSVDSNAYITSASLPTIDQTYDGTSTNAQSGVAVASAVSNVMSVAEGKTKSYVINAATDITGTKDANDEYTGVSAITGVTIANLKIGDIILIKALNVPDYWVSQISPSVSLNKMETTKVDLTNYLTDVEASDINSGNATSGQVLVADGQGGASWGAAASGGSNIFDLGTISGDISSDQVVVLTSAQYTELTSGDVDFVKFTDSNGIVWYCARLLYYSGAAAAFSSASVKVVDNNNSVINILVSTEGNTPFAMVSKKSVDIAKDSSPIQNSTNAVESGGVYTALAGKQDTLSSSVTSNTNPVASVFGFDVNGDLTIDSSSNMLGINNLNNNNVYANQIVGKDANGNWTLGFIDQTSIQSPNATAGQVLTADGNGNANWASPSSSGVTSVNGQTGAVTGLLESTDASTSATANTIVKRDANGDITGRYVYAGWFQTTSATDNANWTDVFVNSSGWLYKRAKASFAGDIGAEVTTNKVTSLSSSSTDTQYPSAKCVYDMIGDVESLLTAINSGNGV